MKVLSIILLLIVGLSHPAYNQGGEMAKFYSYYKPDKKTKEKCDSVYKRIEQRRSDFSREYRKYKETNGSLEGFVFDWAEFEKDILTSLRKTKSGQLRYLIYYSYFDLGYGAYGLHLNPGICRQAMKEIKASSPVWAMEPDLAEKVIRYGGGEDANSKFIRRLLSENRDSNLIRYVKHNLSPERPLKTGKLLPALKYRDLPDTTRLLSVAAFKGKYLLIDIWATWCKPCIDEFPAIVKAYNQKKQDLEFLSISIDKEAWKTIDFLTTKFSIPWFSGIALNQKDLLNTLWVDGIPCTILVSPKGTILAYGYELRGENLQKTLDRVVR